MAASARCRHEGVDRWWGSGTIADAADHPGGRDYVGTPTGFGAGFESHLESLAGG
jgi:hypothetical protein